MNKQMKPTKEKKKRQKRVLKGDINRFSLFHKTQTKNES